MCCERQWKTTEFEAHPCKCQCQGAVAGNMLTPRILAGESGSEMV